MFATLARTLGAFFDSDNRQYEASTLLAVVACFASIILEVYVVVFVHGPEHQPFNIKEFGEGFAAIFIGTGAASWGTGQQRKAQGQGAAAETLADKLPPVTGDSKGQQ